MFNHIKNLIMKQIKEETKLNLTDLNQEELTNTYGGAWWEIRIQNKKLFLIFHPYDYDKPK